MQGVTLAGGLGERLKPLTKAIPKALAPVDGTPIIKKQIDQLLTLGISEVLVLTGYKAEMISDYLLAIYQDTPVKVECIQTPTMFSPAQRLVAAKNKIKKEFILLYCDNYLDDEISIKSVIQSTKPLTLLVEKRDIGNVSISPRIQYSVERRTDFPYVELGYIHVNQSDFISDLENHETLQHYLAQISEKYTCSAVVTHKINKSVSNIERYNNLRKSRKTILLDRDGILNKKMPHRTYLAKFEDYELLENNLSALSEIYAYNTDFIIITNQPGIALGAVDPNFLDQLHSKLVISLLIKGISVIGIYTCTHHWDDNCECRKPKPGMINQAIQDYELDRKKVVYIGDELKDIEASKAADILGIRITEMPNEGEFGSLEEAYNAIQQRISL